MRSKLWTVCGLGAAVWLAAGCAAPGGGRVGETSAGPGALWVEPGPDAAESSLGLWRDPAFRARFTESYVAETEIEPTVTTVDREAMMRVLERMSEARVQDAIALLEENRGDAASAVFDFTLGNLYFQQDRLDEAAAAYRVAVGKYPKFRRAWQNLGMIYVRQSDFAQATEALSRVIELGGGDALTYGLLGFAYGNLEQNLSAESAYRMAILMDPETADWKMGLARAYFQLGRFADAVALTGQMIEKDPGRVEMWLLQANALIGLEQPMRAAENYEIVDRLGGSTPDSLVRLGAIYLNAELDELAVDAYRRALVMDAEPAVPRVVQAAKVLTARGALEPTKDLLGAIEEQAGDLLGDDGRKDLLKMRARIAVAEGASDREARILEEIVEIDPLDGEALILLGQYYQREDDPERAAFYYERAASLDDYEADAKVRHAQLLVRQGKYAEALPMLRRAQEVKPRENVQQFLEQVERVARSG